MHPERSIEIYILSQDDQLLATLTNETGLLSAPFREELNRGSSFSFVVDATEEESAFVVEENQVVFRDKEGELRLYVIKQLDDIDNINGPETKATCEPAFYENKERIIVDKILTNRTATYALDTALEPTRWEGEVEVSLGDQSTNFYYLSCVDAVWKIMDVWGGEFKDVVEFDGNKITRRIIKIVQRRGADRGKRFEIDHDINEIHRTLLSYPITALYGRGSSLETDGGGNTRYIDFADVVWSVANGDPVDKPLGQKWVGDPEALTKYGRLKDDVLLHREDVWQDGMIENPAELLQATWDQVQKVTDPEVNYRLSVHLLEMIADYEHEHVELGDTTIAIDRQFARPIEIVARVIAMEYDLLDIEGTAMVEMGRILSVHEPDDRVERVIETINDNRGRWDNPTVDDNNFPDIIPSIPTNVKADGLFKNVIVSWDYDGSSHIKAYEVYVSELAAFVASPENLIFRGKTSSFSFEGETNKQYYFRVRAINYHGGASNYSAEVTATTARIITDDILFGAVTAEKIANLAITAEKLASGAVTNNKILDDAISEAKIAAGAVTEFKIGTGAITNAKLAALVVDAAKLANSAVTAEKIANLAVGTAAIADAAITNAKISDLHADKITAGLINAARVQIGSGTTFADGFDPTKIEVGGTNLLRNSNFYDGTSYWSGVDGGVKTEDGKNFITIVGTFDVSQVQTTEIGQEYTISMLARKATATDSKISVKFNTDNADTVVVDVTSTSWEKVVLRRVATTSGSQAFYFHTRNSYPVDIAFIKIEKGNKATDWSPSPEDQISYVNSSVKPANDRLALWQYADTVYIDGGNIYANSVTANQMAVGTITAASAIIADAAITSAKIANLAVGTAAIANLGVTTAKIANLAVGTAQIANAAITNAKIGNLAVDTAQIANAAITDAKIGSLSANKITTGTLSSITITSVDIKSSRITVGTDTSALRFFDTSNNFLGFFSSGGLYIDKDLKLGINSKFVFEGHDTVLTVSDGISSNGLPPVTIFRKEEWLNGAWSLSRSGYEFQNDVEVKGNLVVSGNLTLGGYLLKSIKSVGDTNKVLSTINASPTGVDSWNNAINTNLLLRNSNNAISIIVGGTTNDRKALIQVGHSSTSFAQYLGSLDLNPFGGDVKANGIKVSVDGHTHAYLPTTGGTISGNLGVGASSGESTLFQMTAVETYNHAFLKLGNVAIKGLNATTHRLDVRNTADTAFLPIMASAFTVSSRREWKKNIADYSNKALSKINTTKVHEYHMNEDLDTELKRVGFLYDEVPFEMADIGGMGVELYSTTAMLWKGVQELSDEINLLKNEIALLKAS